MLFRKKMKIEFNDLKESAKTLDKDRTELLLYVAKKFLEQIPDHAPSDDPYEKTQFAISAEGFLYFIIGARDSLLQEINDNLSQPKLATHKVGLNPKIHSNFLQKLSHEKPKIKEMLDNCMKEPDTIINPTHNPPIWNRSKSWLWEITEARNTIAHKTNLGRALVAIGGISVTARRALVCYREEHKALFNQKEDGSKVKIEKSFPLQIEEKNPQNYFQISFDKFNKLKNEVGKLLA